MQFRISIKIMYSLICTLSIRLSCGRFYVCCSPRWTMYKICWYLTNCYVTEEPLFPPVFWVEAPSHVKCTNNGPESFHIHFNEQFYCSHPSIYVFIYNVLKLQSASYIKIRNIEQSASQSRFEKEKVQLLIKYHQSYVNREMSRNHYTQCNWVQVKLTWNLCINWNFLESWYFYSVS